MAEQIFEQLLTGALDADPTALERGSKAILRIAMGM